MQTPRFQNVCSRPIKLLNFKISLVSVPSVTPPLGLTYICSHIRHMILNTSNTFSCQHWFGMEIVMHVQRISYLIGSTHKNPFPMLFGNFRPLFYIEGLRGHLTHQHFFWWSIQYLTIKWLESTNKQPMDR